MAGKVAVVTGGNSGIGKETAAALAAMDAQVIIAARNPAKAAAAVAEIRRRTPGANVEHLPLDLASFASVHAFADAFAARFDRLDVLVNNAGLTVHKRELTEDGHEMQFQVNHSRPLPAHPAPARPARGRARGARRERLVDRPHLCQAGPRFRRPRMGAPQVPRLSRVLRDQARQRAVHARARPPRRGHQPHGQRGAPRLRRLQLRARGRHGLVHRPRHARDPAVRDLEREAARSPRCTSRRRPTSTASPASTSTSAGS